MKEILMSIRPEWCKRIFNGEKTIEVRKTRPLIDMPFKVFMYETKAQFVKSIRGACTTFGYGRGKVIGSFVCDKIDEYEANERGWYIYPQDETCLLCDEIAHYGKGKPLYGWHITAPTLFDKPKELSEFFVPCKKYNDSELHCMEWDCEHYSFFPDANGDAEEECLCKRRKPLTRPPMSWCYVEDK